MTDREALVSLNMCLDIGSIRLRKLLEYFGKPENILNAPHEKLMRVCGIGEKIAAGIVAFKKEDLEQEFRLADKHNLAIITWGSPDYPHNLANIFDPPIVLYVKGEIKKEDCLCIAVVGSRRASFYGLANARKIAGDLSDKGFTVVSGLARGIDTAAHQGALKQKGRTLAIMGSGFNHVYPLENRDLAEEIAGNGAVVSEFPIDMGPMRQNFPRRNRIISGLSLGVVVVEAARNSGALITADFALEQGREVFALPGKIDSGNAVGTNDLIKQGAKLITSVEDIMEEFQLGLRIECENLPVMERERVVTVLPDLSSQETALLALLSDEAVHLDEIAQNSGMHISKIYSILLGLQQRDLIQELPGKQFVRIRHD